MSDLKKYSIFLFLLIILNSCGVKGKLYRVDEINDKSDL
ncbi:MAG: putative small lipoprotein YifL [Candidatus Midichloriaceae bacterium]|jgi:predicted small lipoprotein YifL